MRVWHVCAHKALVNNANGWKWSDTERGGMKREGEGAVVNKMRKNCSILPAEHWIYRFTGNLEITRGTCRLWYTCCYLLDGGGGCREIKITCSSIRSLKRFYTIVYGNVYEYLLFSFGKNSMTYDFRIFPFSFEENTERILVRKFKYFWCSSMLYFFLLL